MHWEDLPGRAYGNDPNVHKYRLWCSENDDHAGAVSSFEGKQRMEFYPITICSPWSVVSVNYSGYSTYTFENGDALTLSFTGGWGENGGGGDYEVISGTGAFEGATGTGRFDGVDDPWEDASLADGSFTLNLPKN